MPILKFEVQADYEKVIRLREEIQRLDHLLRTLPNDTPSATIHNIEKELASARGEFKSLTDAALKAGAELEDGFKKRIFDASQSVNDFTEKIIAQKDKVKNLSFEVKKLGEEYRNSIGKNPAKSTYYKGEYEGAKKALEEEKAALFALTQEQATARLSVKRLRDEYALMKEGAGESGAMFEEMKRQLTGMGKDILGTLGVGFGIKEFIGQMVQTRGEFQQIETSFEVLLGSEEKAAKLMGEVKEFAKVSPLDLKSTAAATQMMLGFNIEAEKVPRFLQAIGDVAMGDAQRFNSLTLAFSQMSATGKLMGQDLNQMINAGFNPLQIMSEKTGKSIATLKEEMSKGAITSEMVQQAFIDATSAGGKFYQMSERASKTINGQISMMQDALDAMFNSLGEQSEGAILGAIETTTSLIENYETVGKVLAGLIATYGAYKTAVILNITLTKSWAVAARADATAKGIQTIATKAATIAQQGFNAAMKANPYGLAAAALIAVGTAVWAYASRADKAEESQKKLNEAFSKMQGEIQGEQANIELLFGSLKKAEKGTDDYQKTKNLIISQYGDYLKGLIDERNELIDLEAAYYRVSAAAKDAANSRALESYTKDAQSAFADAQTEAINEIQSVINKRVNNSNMRNTLLELVRRDMAKNGILSISTENMLGSAFGESRNKAQLWNKDSGVNKIKELTSDVRVAKQNLMSDLESANAKFGVMSNEFANFSTDQLSVAKEMLQSQIDAGETSDFIITQNGKEIASYENLADAELALLKIEEAITTKRAESKAKADKNLKTSYDKAEEELKNANAEQKASDELLALKRQTQQSEIDIMQDGLDKKIAQINLDYDKQQDAIAKRERELTAKNKEQGISGLTAEQTAAIEAERKASEAVRDKQMADARNSDLQYMRDYLKEYGTFQQQKLAIAEEYNERIANSANEWERKSLAEQRDAAVRQVDINAIKRQIDWGGVFGDFSSMFRSQLQPTIDKLQAIAGSDGFRASPLEEQKVLYDLISKLEQSATVWDSDIFVRISDDLVRHQQTMSQLYTEQERNQVILNELEKAKSRLASAQSSGDDNAVMQAQVSVDSWSAALLNSNEAIRSLESSAQETSASLSELSTKAVTQFQQLESGLRGLSSGSLQGVGQGIMQLDRTFNSDKITSTVGNALAGGVTKLFGKNSEATKKLTEVLGETGMAGEIISAGLGILDILRDGVDNLVTSLLDTVLGGVNGLLDSLLSKDTYINIGKSLRDNIGNILNSATFGGFKSLFSSSNAKEVNETTERLTNANDRLRESVDELKDEMSKSGGWRAISAATQAEADQRKINQQTMEILKAQMGYTGAHHSNAYYWGLGQGDYASLNKTLADYARKNPNADTATNAVGSLEDIYKLTPEQMDYIRTYNIEMWERMITQGKYDKSGYWEQYADLAGELESITESLRETLTQTSFDSLRSSFVDSLMDMEKDASDFADDFSQMMMKAMLNSRIDDLLGDELEQFYKQWAEMAKSDGGLDSNEIKQLQEWWQRLTEAGIAVRDEIASITGYDTSSFSQKPSVGGYQSMGEDTGQEMNGRLTAIQEGVYQIRDLDIERNELLRGLGGASLENVPVTQISTEALQSLSAQMAEQYTVHTDTRRILAESYLELQQIRENTGAIVKPIKSMRDDLKNLRKDIKDKL